MSGITRVQAGFRVPVNEHASASGGGGWDG
jgi:hypothetical protein